MKSRIFIPFQQFGDIQFGENYLAVRQKLNSPFTQQYFDANAKNFTDFFDELGFKVEYDNDNNVFSMEAFNEADFDFIFMGNNLHLMPFVAVEKILRKLDDTMENFSIGIY